MIGVLHRSVTVTVSWVLYAVVVLYCTKFLLIGDLWHYPTHSLTLFSLLLLLLLLCRCLKTPPCCPTRAPPSPEVAPSAPPPTLPPSPPVAKLHCRASGREVTHSVLSGVKGLASLIIAFKERSHACSCANCAAGIVLIITMLLVFVYRWLTNVCSPHLKSFLNRI